TWSLGGAGLATSVFRPEKPFAAPRASRRQRAGGTGSSSAWPAQHGAGTHPFARLLGKREHDLAGAQLPRPDDFVEADQKPDTAEVANAREVEAPGTLPHAEPLGPPALQPAGDLHGGDGRHEMVDRARVDLQLLEHPAQRRRGERHAPAKHVEIAILLERDLASPRPRHRTITASASAASERPSVASAQRSTSASSPPSFAA